MHSVNRAVFVAQRKRKCLVIRKSCFRILSSVIKLFLLSLYHHIDQTGHSWMCNITDFIRKMGAQLKVKQAINNWINNNCRIPLKATFAMRALTAVTADWQNRTLGLNKK